MYLFTILLTVADNIQSDSDHSSDEGEWLLKYFDSEIHYVHFTEKF